MLHMHAHRHKILTSRAPVGAKKIKWENNNKLLDIHSVIRVKPYPDFYKNLDLLSIGTSLEFHGQ